MGYFAHELLLTSGWVKDHSARRSTVRRVRGADGFWGVYLVSSQEIRVCVRRFPVYGVSLHPLVRFDKFDVTARTTKMDVSTGDLIVFASPLLRCFTFKKFTPMPRDVLSSSVDARRLLSLFTRPTGRRVISDREILGCFGTYIGTAIATV